MKYTRYLKLDEILSKSVFLLGPRQTGKTTLIKEQLPESLYINLLKSEVFIELQRNPEKLRNKISKNDKLVIIDEIQRIPELLNEVHYLIEEHSIKFLLTGSSARKLRKKGINLLGGRARNYQLFPLTSSELGEDFNLDRNLLIGTIPSIVLSDNFQADLSTYIENYLQLEISQEALTRNIPAFSRFLEVAALSNTQIINYTKFANDAQIAPSTAQEYFQILRDTLMGFDLPVWRQTKKRKVAKTSKFYFFDNGIANAILRKWNLNRNSSDYGTALEAFIFHELTAFSKYNSLAPLFYWRTQAKDEVDFILNESIAIEVKATRNISQKDFSGLKKLKEENLLKRYILLCDVSSKEYRDNIEIWPIKDFLEALWKGEFIL